MSIRQLAVGLAISFAAGGVVEAKEIEVIGRAAVAIPAGPGAPVQTVRATAIREAKRRATIAAIDEILGPNASQGPGVSGQIDAVIAQIPEDRIVDSKATRVGDNYEVSIKLVLDDKEFRALLSNLGLAIHTIRVRRSAILAVMDEFLATARDLQAPLEELAEFSGERATGAREGSKAGKDRDNHRYQKLIRYQPRSGKPEKTSRAYAALVGQLQEYDLRILDNDVFRSRYFKDQPLTIEQMENGAALSRYVAFARSEARADFLMVGNSIIIDSGKNPNTGDVQCTAAVTVKTYSTADGEDIASETFSESSLGMNIADCAANVARKVARVGGPIIGARIQDYWKRRSTYGREYVLTLRGARLSLMVKTAFMSALRSIPGVESDNQRASSVRELQVVASYKGTDPLDQALATRLSSNPAFAHLDSRTDDNQVLLCLGPCGGSSVPKRPGSGVPPVVTSIAADAGADGRDAGSLVARNPTPLVMPLHRDRALVVATDRYASPAWPRLAFPVRDARRIARALKGHGFEVTLLENATVAQFERAFQRLATESWGEYDQFLVYIAGHGDFREAWHSGRLVLADSTDDVGNYKSWPELRDALTGHRSRHVLLVLDVCYGGTFEPAVAFEGAERLAYRGAPHEIDERQAVARLGRRTRRFLSSVGKDLTPDRSAFAAALAAFLEDAQNRYRTDLDLAATVQHVSPSPVASSFQGDEAAGAFVFHPARGDVERR
jgi:hypothetical protein